MNPLQKLRIFLFAVATIFIILGLQRGEARVVFNKAVRICMECIGLG